VTGDRPVVILELDHVVLRVRDQGASQRFYIRDPDGYRIELKPR